MQGCFYHIILLAGIYKCTVSSAYEHHATCSKDCMKKVLERNVTEYQDCMRICLYSHGEEWLLNNATTCFTANHYSDAAPACSAKDIRIASDSVHVTSSRSSQAWREFVSVIWTACPYGISDVTGYEVQLFETDLLGYSYCKSVSLNRRLDSKSINDQFSVLFDLQELDYSTKYQIWIEGLPKTSHRHHAYIEYTSLSCTRLNGEGSCECGLQGFRNLPSVNVTMSGYAVLFSISMMPDCFAVFKYKVSLLFNFSKALQTVDITPSKSVTIVQHAFYPVYALPAGSSLVVQYRAFSKRGDVGISQPVPIYVNDWKASISSVQIKATTVTVEWLCAPKIFNITKYELKLSLHGTHLNESSQEIIEHISSPCLLNENITFARKSLVLVQSGTYSVQIRGWRAPAPPFTMSEWSHVTANTTFMYGHQWKLLEQKTFLVATAVLFPITVVVAACIGILYCGKKGYCKKIRHQLPISIEYLLDSADKFQHCSKSVWIVWQADTRNEVMKEIHSENIRHLAAFFSNHCGLNVLLDQYDALTTGNLSTWIFEKHEEAEVVLFVCPHFSNKQVEESDVGATHFFGNFSVIFRYYEKALLSGKCESKFLTVTLPYSEKNASATAQLLCKTTPVFNLMDDIEDLYFYIQGFPKVNRFGRHVVKNIRGTEFASTAEGKALKNGIKKMMQFNKQGVDLTAEIEKLKKEETKISSLVPDTNILETKGPCAEIEETFLNKARSFKPNPPPTVIEEEDPDESMFLINAQDLLSVHYHASRSPPVVVDESCALLSQLQCSSHLQNSLAPVPHPLVKHSNSFNIESSSSNSEFHDSDCEIFQCQYGQ